MVPDPSVTGTKPQVALPTVDSMNDCIATAKRSVEEQLQDIPFDPQGRIITQGLIVGKKTTISMDYSQNQLFLEWVRKGLGNVAEKEKIVEQLNNTPKGSIIPLQQEFYFQLALVGRMYEMVLQAKALNGISNPELSSKIQAAHQAAMKDVNLLVRDAYARALQKAYRAGKPTLDLAVLIKELDKARKSIAPEAHRIFMQHVIQQTGQTFSKKDLVSLEKTHPEQMTASPDDLLHIDASLGIATWIEGTKTTAHHSNEGIVAQRLWGTYAYVAEAPQPIQRLRTLDRCGLIKLSGHPKDMDLNDLSKPLYASYKGEFFYIDGISKPHKLSIGAWEASGIEKLFSPTFRFADDFSKAQLEKLTSILLPAPPIRIRTPSLVSEEGGLKTPVKKIGQVVLNLKEIHSRYLAAAQLQQPFVYNVLMSLSSQNDQIDRIKHILLGAHQYNRARGPDDTDPWCLVQAIGTNGFGSELGYGGGWPFWRTSAKVVRQEATLMAEMALVATITGFQKEDMPKYKGFLASYDGVKKTFFFTTDGGKETRKSIQRTKDSWKTEQTGASGNAQDDAKVCLRKLVANDAHFSHQNARLIQSLSVFVEPVSIAGCKSGNERAQGISSRDVLLDAMERLAVAEPGVHPQSHILLARTLKGALAKLAESTPDTYATSVEELNNALDDFYNQVGLQGAMTLIADTDMGASSKVDAQKKVESPWFKGGFKRGFLEPLRQFFKTLGNWNTNRAESSALTNLSQTTSFMQAHNRSFFKLIKGGIGAAVVQPPCSAPVEPGLVSSGRATVSSTASIISLEAAHPVAVGTHTPVQADNSVVVATRAPSLGGDTTPNITAVLDGEDEADRDSPRPHSS